MKNLSYFYDAVSVTKTITKKQTLFMLTAVFIYVEPLQMEKSVM